MFVCSSQWGEEVRNRKKEGNERKTKRRHRTGATSMPMSMPDGIRSVRGRVLCEPMSPEFQYAEGGLAFNHDG